MQLTIHRLTLPLAHPFTISRGSITEQTSLVVELECDGIRGLGEVTENTYYHQTFDSLSQAIHRSEAILPRYANESPNDVWPDLLRAVGNNYFAASAIDIAAHDFHARRLNVPTYQAWGLHWQNVPESSFTIGIDTIEVMQQKLAEQPGWNIYKIKLGTAHDVEIVRRLREHTTATFRVDANCGWTVQEAIENSRVLASLGVEFIEQPLPADADSSDKLLVFRESSLPIIADESCQREADVEACQGLFHGINVKICKCGGLTPAVRMLRRAQELGMRTMVGCMIESSVGISGAAQLLPLLDYADLDGATLLSRDPAMGIRLKNGQVQLSTLPGNGASLLA
ncbi:MAG: dipeptide epimerase [Pirellulaceae bacterium]